MQDTSNELYYPCSAGKSDDVRLKENSHLCCGDQTPGQPALHQLANCLHLSHSHPAVTEELLG